VLTDPLKVAISRVAKRLARRAGYSLRRIDFDPETAATIRRVRDKTMTSPERIAALCSSVRYIVQGDVPGAVVECGVWRGGSMMAAALTLMRLGAERELYLFDTFEGMVAPTAADVSVYGQSARDTFATHARTTGAAYSDWCYAGLSEVRSALLSTGYPERLIHFVKGRVEDTLPAEAPACISLLRLDTDFYESTRRELTHLYDRVAAGGVLIIDDYGHWQGSKKATDEFLAQRSIPLLLTRIDRAGRLAIVPPRPSAVGPADAGPRPLPDHPGGVAGGDGPGRYGAGDDRSGADHGVRPDGHAPEDGGVGPDPDVVADDNGEV
jgi:hypothetical protein